MGHRATRALSGAARRERKLPAAPAATDTMVVGTRRLQGAAPQEGRQQRRGGERGGLHTGRQGGRTHADVRQRQGENSPRRKNATPQMRDQGYARSHDNCRLR